MILELIDEAVHSGARAGKACAMLGISQRAIQRWKGALKGDRRCGPRCEPANKLSAEERERVLQIANSKQFRDMSPKQIVPRLADEGHYVASESTMYRILREEGLLNHRMSSRPPSAPPKARVATGPCQVWSWDITYLKTTIKGRFFYLYLFMDVWSRMIVAAEVFAEELSDHGSRLLAGACLRHSFDPQSALVLHSDNGGPMKGSTMLATLQSLGVVPSFSRPRVSDDNPYSESLFRTLKYRPEYPSRPFETLEEARRWVTGFVKWYNTEHLHSSIRFVTPADRHYGREKRILEKRRQVYARARCTNPLRWSKNLRNWEPAGEVWLNHKHQQGAQLEQAV